MQLWGWSNSVWKLNGDSSVGKNFQWLTFQTVNHITKGKKKGFVQALKTVFKKKIPQSVEKQTDESRPEDDSTVAYSITYGLLSIILCFSMILN